MIKHAETLQLPLPLQLIPISIVSDVMSKCSINVSVTGSRAKTFGHPLVLRELTIIQMYDKCETFSIISLHLT